MLYIKRYSLKEDNIKTGDNVKLTNREKEHLKSRLLGSVRSLKARRRRTKYSIGISMAASIALITGLWLFFEGNATQSISEFAKSSTHSNKMGADEVVLVLEEGENVAVEEETARINYSASGEQVSIGNHKAIEQKAIKDQKLVYNTLIVPYGKRSVLELSDGSTVWLNSGSRLVYPVVFNKDKREVFLEGEAIFKVSHNKQHPFIVLSEGQEIEVLGTEFNVSSYLDDQSTNTVLKSGSIRIHYGKKNMLSAKDQLHIDPGTMASYDRVKGSMRSRQVDVDRYFSWRNGELIFRNDNLGYIMKKLSRYYNVEITIEDQTSGLGTFSGHLDLKEDLDKVIGIIKETTDLKYQWIEDNKIIINKLN